MPSPTCAAGTAVTPSPAGEQRDRWRHGQSTIDQISGLPLLLPDMYYVTLHTLSQHHIPSAGRPVALSECFR